MQFKNAISYLLQNLKQTHVLRILHNTAWLVIGQVVLLGVSAIIGMFMVRYLGPSRMGMLAFASGFVGLFIPLAQLGLESIVTLELVRSDERSKTLLVSAFFLRLMASVVAMLLCVGVVWPLTADDLYSRNLVLIASLLILPGSVEIASCWFESRVESQYVVRARLLALAISSVLRLLAIFYGASLIIFVWLLVIEAVLRALLILLNLYRHYATSQTQQPWCQWSVMRSLLFNGLPLTLMSVAVSIYMQVDMVMLKLMVDNTAAGYYAVPVQILSMAAFVGFAFSSSVFPAIIKVKEVNPPLYAMRMQQLYDLTTWLGIAGSLVLVSLSSILIPLLFGQSYLPSVTMLNWLAGTIVFIWPGCIQGRWTVTENVQRLMLWPTLAGALLNVILNTLLIPRWQGNGAAIASLITYVVVTLLGPLLFKRTRQSGQMLLLAYLAPLRWVGLMSAPWSKDISNGDDNAS